MTLDKEAVIYVKRNWKDLIKKFIPADYVSTEHPESFFTAGAPGVGKTEFAVGFIKKLAMQVPPVRLVHLDPDEVRKIIPGYNPANVADTQRAVGLCLQRFFDHAQKNNISLLLDGTFSAYQMAYNNISRSLGRNRKVGIIYLYQDPLQSWQNTKYREKLEGRVVPPEMFVDSFFLAIDNVNKIKAEFGDNVEVQLILKNNDNSVSKTEFNIDNIDHYINNGYTRESLFQAIIDTTTIKC